MQNRATPDTIQRREFLSEVFVGVMGDLVGGRVGGSGTLREKKGIREILGFLADERCTCGVRYAYERACTCAGVYMLHMCVYRIRVRVHTVFVCLCVCICVCCVCFVQRAKRKTSLMYR
jgi:hypothetical protein